MADSAGRIVVPMAVEWENSWITWITSVTGCLNALGIECSLADVAGETGYAFHLGIHPELCQSGLFVCDWDALCRGIRTLGRSTEFYHAGEFHNPGTLNARTRKHCRAAFELARREIGDGRPCVILGAYIAEFAICYGVEDAGKVPAPSGESLSTGKSANAGRHSPSLPVAPEASVVPDESMARGESVAPGLPAVPGGGEDTGKAPAPPGEGGFNGKYLVKSYREHWGGEQAPVKYDETDCPAGAYTLAFPSPVHFRLRMRDRDAIVNAPRFFNNRGYSYRYGADGYDMWIDALKAKRAGAFGNAFNAQCYAELKGFARDYVAGLAERNQLCTEDLGKAAKQYKKVADAMAEVAKIFPSIEWTEAKVEDDAAIKKAADALKDAKKAEVKAMKYLEKVAMADWPMIKS